MKIIKYEKDQNNYVLIFKTRIFIYYLFNINNVISYHQKFNGKNYNKTYKISKKIFKTNELKISSQKYDDYTLAYKCDSYVYGKSEYYITSETYGDEKGVTFCVFKDGQKKDIFKGQRYSATFLTSYLMTKFEFPFPPHYYIHCDIFIPFMDMSQMNKINRYCEFLFFKFSKFDFKDIKVNFEHLLHTSNFYYMTKIFSYYDEIIKINTKKIIKKFNLEGDFNKRCGTIYYALSYFSLLFFKLYIKQNKIENSKILINSCLFGNKYCKEYFDDSNEYIFSDYNSLRNGWMFFIDEKYNKYISKTENELKQKITIHLQEIINKHLE